MHHVKLILLLYLCIWMSANAQTPYDSFAPETSRPILTSEALSREKCAQDFSSDTTLLVAMIDTQQERILLVDMSDGSIVAYALLTDNKSHWLSPDPLLDKYPEISSYAYCHWSPMRYVDPDGRDIYRYDDKSGTFHLYQETNDDFDQVARFRYNKETGNYELKTSKNGDIKIRMDNVEKGILSDGINLLTDSQVWSTDKVSIEGFQNFIVAYSDMIGREMGGYYYSEIGGTNIKYINSGMGKNNTQTMSYPGPGIFHVQPDLYGKVVPHTNWHTHPSYADNKLEPSGEDREFKREQSKHGLKRFIILTGGSSPIEY